MGYDMTLVETPEGEAEKVAAAWAILNAAARERDALPKEEAGTQRDPKDIFAPCLDASDRYKAAQNAVLRASARRDEAEASSFRLNIWGMRVVRQAMLELGMAYSTAEQPFPRPANDRIRDIGWYLDEDDEALAAVTPPPTGDELTAARAFRDQAEAHLRAHPDGGAGIPLHKFGTNDGWLVTPEECRAALDAHNAADIDHRRAVLADLDIPPEGYWARWLGYLDLATRHGGFRVY